MFSRFIGGKSRIRCNCCDFSCPLYYVRPYYQTWYDTGHTLIRGVDYDYNDNALRIVVDEKLHQM